MPHPNQTPWDETIIAKLATSPYVSMSDDDAICVALNAETVAGPTVDITITKVLAYLALNGNLLMLLNFAKGSPTGDAVHDAAWGAAATLAVLINAPAPPVLETSNPTAFARMEGMLDALLAQELASANSTGVTQVAHDGLLALTQTSIPWWQSIGSNSPLNSADLERARS